MHESTLELTNPSLAGGLGGTNFIPTSVTGAHDYEGIDIGSKENCLREPTIKRLADKLSEVGVLLVRSPPMAGKTSLSQLLEQHFLKDSSLRVIRMSLLWMGPADGTWTFAEKFKYLMGGTTWEDFVDQCNIIPTILIVDKAQVSINT
jgi:hypothetical protein